MGEGLRVGSVIINNDNENAEGIISGKLTQNRRSVPILRVLSVAFLPGGYSRLFPLRSSQPTVRFRLPFTYLITAWDVLLYGNSTSCIPRLLNSGPGFRTNKAS